MTKRTKKLLSLLLATTMVFSLNTTVFAEEVAVDSVEETVEATVDAVDEVAEEATVDSTDDAAAATSTTENDGIITNTETGKAITSIKFASNGDKKNEKFNVCTITNTTDPTSWNNIGTGYAEDLIATVLFGGEGKDEWLNNGSKVTVSLNDPMNGEGLEGRVDAGDLTYEVIPVVDGSEYLFVGYGIRKGPAEDATAWTYGNDYVVGGSEVKEYFAKKTTLTKIPTAEWDGRQIDYNKSGDYKFGTGKKEALDVAIAFVTYANGTVTEVNGVDVASVKVDKKNQKAASVKFDTVAKSETVVVDNTEKPGETKSVTKYFEEHETLGDLPFFTIKASVKGDDAKGYKKDINAKLKDKKFLFGIKQKAVSVIFNADVTNAYKNNIKSEGSTVSEDDLKKVSQNDIDEAEKNIAAALVDEPSYFNADTDSVLVDDFEVTKFTDKGATVTLKGWTGDTNKGYSWSSLKTISGKGKNAEYSFEDGTLANTSVKALTFKDGGNFVYRPLTLAITEDEKGTSQRNWGDTDDLAPVGYKWAFRKSPEEKSKKFRYGVFKENGNGFVYSVDDAVEEAF